MFKKNNNKIQDVNVPGHRARVCLGINKSYCEVFLYVQTSAQACAWFSGMGI